MLERIYYCGWVLLHLVYLLTQELTEWVIVIWNQCSNRLSSCWPARSSLVDYSTLVKSTQGLKKHPSHVAWLITPEEADSSQVGILQKLKFIMTRHRKRWTKGSPRRKPGLEVETVSKLVAWSWAANIPVVTLYDYYGELKELKEDLMYSIQDEIASNLWAVRKVQPKAQIPKVCFHKVGEGDKDIPWSQMTINGGADLRSLDSIHIFVLSSEDGRARIVETARNICRERLQQHKDGVPLSPITESSLDQEFSFGSGHRSSLTSDPDILVISGNVNSTLGFSPWNIRLSEMYWVPKLPLVDASHFINVLETYSGCQQRFGK